MRTSIIFIVALLCFSFAHAQNGNSSKPVEVLYIIKTDTSITRTNHLFVDSKDIVHIDLPSKAEASKSLGPIKEDVVVYITLKQGVKLLTLSKLLAKNKLGVDYNNTPVYINDELIPNPDDILSTETGLKDLKRTFKRIDIITKSGSRLRKVTGTRH